MPWWDPVDLPIGQELSLELGLVGICVARHDGLVRIGRRALAIQEGEAVRLDGPRPMAELDPPWEVQRHAVRAGAVSLVPRTAPRPVVARPEVPFSVAPGAQVKVFVSTPLWVEVRVGGTALSEFPVVPTKPTWFGTSVEGEECFAMRTVMRLSLAEVVLRPHRAVAPVTIVNEGVDALRIERLWIPVHHLTLHVDPEGRLWTREVHLTRREGQEQAERHLGRAGPGPAVAQPREKPVENVVVRVFNSVFG